MGILSWIVFGLIAGIIAKWIMPGKDPGGFIITILLVICLSLSLYQSFYYLLYRCSLHANDILLSLLHSYIRLYLFNLLLFFVSLSLFLINFYFCFLFALLCFASLLTSLNLLLKFSFIGLVVGHRECVRVAGVLHMAGVFLYNFRNDVCQVVSSEATAATLVIIVTFFYFYLSLFSFHQPVPVAVVTSSATRCHTGAPESESLFQV